MEELAHEGSTMIVVTHEMAFAREAADRVYFIEEGVFVEGGPPEQVIDAPQDRTHPGLPLEAADPGLSPSDGRLLAPIFLLRNETGVAPQGPGHTFTSRSLSRRPTLGVGSPVTRSPGEPSAGFSTLREGRGGDPTHGTGRASGQDGAGSRTRFRG